MLTFSSLSKRGQSSRYRLSGFLCPAKRWSAEKSNKATRICFGAAAICYSFALGRSSENLPRSSVIGRMVVIDLGVNVCASLSPSSHHLPSHYPRNSFPLLRILPPTLPEDSSGWHRGSARRLPSEIPVCPLLPKDAVNPTLAPPGPRLSRWLFFGPFGKYQGSLDQHHTAKSCRITATLKTMKFNLWALAPLLGIPRQML